MKEEMMEIGIGTPATIPGCSGDLVLEWARTADAGPFASLAIIDRLVYPNYEPLITLAACAGATHRIRLVTSVLLAPLRNPALLAKEAASLDALSGGRLTLGLGVGAREDDFSAASVNYHERGNIFDEQLALMRRVWAGGPVNADAGPMGPAPAREGGPAILIGGYSPAALKRVGKWGDGFLAGGTDAATAKQLYELALESWHAEGRHGKPRFVTAFYYGLGERSAERTAEYIRHYYAFMPHVEQMAQSVPSTPQAVKERIETFADAGADEVLAWPTIPEIAQVDLLAELIQ
jgi:alkanesulfonate monooxygenase SsuD/methylene tetrahydromethanopterin reductase-like flavin-dependent oxidoreductase (luciferase family)